MCGRVCVIHKCKAVTDQTVWSLCFVLNATGGSHSAGLSLLAKERSEFVGICGEKALPCTDILLGTWQTPFKSKVRRALREHLTCTGPSFSISATALIKANI